MLFFLNKIFFYIGLVVMEILVLLFFIDDRKIKGMM